MANKEIILDKIVDLFNQKIEEIENSIRETSEQLKSAPTAMESHSDTSRFQLGIILQNLNNRKNDLVQLEAFLKKPNLGPKEKSDVGSLVVLNDEETCFFILPTGAGFIETIIENKKVIALGQDTVLGKQLLNLKKGDQINLNLPKGNLKTIVRDVS